MFDTGPIYCPASVPEAIALLKQHEDAVLLNGGTDVLIRIREGKWREKPLINISGIPGLSGISIEQNGDLCIKAGTVFSHIAGSPVVNEYIPILSLAADTVGGPQIRNMATIGGNICNAAPSADSAPALLVLEADLVFQGGQAQQERRPILGFFRGPGATERQHTQILTHILISPRSYLHWSGHYTKYAMRNAMDIATLSCAVLLQLTEERRHIKDIRVAFGVAAPTPIRCPNLEKALSGVSLAEAEQIFVSHVALDIAPRSSWRATAEFRLHLAGEIGVRTMFRAIEKAGGNIFRDKRDIVVDQRFCQDSPY